MRLKKVTIISNDTHVHAAMMDIYHPVGNVGDPTTLPSGRFGTIIKIELVIDVPDNETWKQPT